MYGAKFFLEFASFWEFVIGKPHQICDMHSTLYRDTTLWIPLKTPAGILFQRYFQKFSIHRVTMEQRMYTVSQESVPGCVASFVSGISWFTHHKNITLPPASLRYGWGYWWKLQWQNVVVLVKTLRPGGNKNQDCDLSSDLLKPKWFHSFV